MGIGADGQIMGRQDDELASYDGYEDTLFLPATIVVAFLLALVGLAAYIMQNHKLEVIAFQAKAKRFIKKLRRKYNELSGASPSLDFSPRGPTTPRRAKGFSVPLEDDTEGSVLDDDEACTLGNAIDRPTTPTQSEFCGSELSASSSSSRAQLCRQGSRAAELQFGVKKPRKSSGHESSSPRSTAQDNSGRGVKTGTCRDVEEVSSSAQDARLTDVSGSGTDSAGSDTEGRAVHVIPQRSCGRSQRS